jgi:hypothetical protein
MRMGERFLAFVPKYRRPAHFCQEISFDRAVVSRRDQVTGTLNTTIQYCTDCRSNPIKIKPNPITPSRLSGRLSIFHSITGLKRLTSALTVPAAKPSFSPKTTQ